MSRQTSATGLRHYTTICLIFTASSRLRLLKLPAPDLGKDGCRWQWNFPSATSCRPSWPSSSWFWGSACRQMLGKGLEDSRHSRKIAHIPGYLRASSAQRTLVVQRLASWRNSLLQRTPTADGSAFNAVLQLRRCKWPRKGGFCLHPLRSSTV